VHLANSLVWRSITSEEPPTVPFTSKEYTQAGLPWFEYFNESAAPVDGTDKLNGMKSVAQMGKEKSDKPLPENESVDVQTVIPPQESRRLTVEILCRVDKLLDMAILTYNHWTNYQPARLHA
jgi:hypothetical protein